LAALPICPHYVVEIYNTLTLQMPTRNMPLL
jgi:hypothetical protein